MEENPIRDSLEAATDEPASSFHPPVPGAPPDPDARGDTPEDKAYWRGVRDGIECKGPARGFRHVPPDWDSPLCRAPAEDSPPLNWQALAESFPPVRRDSSGRLIRKDGFTPARQRIFLSVLAACGVVGDACRAAGISRDTAYALRQRAEGRAFAIAWDAGVLLARGRMGDELMSRALNGVIERVFRDGVLVAERHRHDNRLAMAVLTRLDRQAEGLGEGAHAARLAAQEWDQFLDIVADDGAGADDFFRLRTAGEVKEPPTTDGYAPEPGSDAAALARLSLWRDLGAGLPAEVDGDLEPEEMASWSAEDWRRADLAGMLDELPEEEWPEIARTEDDAELDGDCPECQDIETGASRVRDEYRGRFAVREGPEPPDPEDRLLEDGGAWQDEQTGAWMTGFPPPEAFDGEQYGEWGALDYRRTLNPAEQAAIDAAIARAAAEEEAGQAEHRALAARARDRFFGLDERAGEAAPAEPPCPARPRSVRIGDENPGGDPR